MNEEETKQLPEAPVEGAIVDPEDEEYSQFLRDNLGDEYDETDEKKNRRGLMDYVNRNKKGTERINRSMRKDPRFAQAFSDMSSGKRGAHGALARYFGKDFLTAEEGTPEYDEIMAAEEERLKEMEEAAKARDEYEQNYNQSVPIIQQFCEEKGYDFDEFRDKIWNMIALPIMEGRYDQNFLELLDKAMNYDKDVQDAMAAGEVKGRNTNINAMRKDKQTPTILQTGGTPVKESKKQSKIGGLIGDATSI